MVGWGKTAKFSVKGGRHFSLSEVAKERERERERKRVRERKRDKELEGLGRVERWLSCVFRWVEGVAGWVVGKEGGGGRLVGWRRLWIVENGYQGLLGRGGDEENEGVEG